MPKSPESMGGTPEEKKGMSFQEVLSMTPDKLAEEKKKQIIERALKQGVEEMKSEMLTESLWRIEKEVSNRDKIFDDISPFSKWVKGQEVDPQEDDTIYPFFKGEEKKMEEWKVLAKAFLERVKQEVNQSNFPYQLDFSIEQKGPRIHVVLKVDKKESSK